MPLGHLRGIGKRSLMGGDFDSGAGGCRLAMRLRSGAPALLESNPILALLAKLTHFGAPPAWAPRAPGHPKPTPHLSARALRTSP